MNLNQKSEMAPVQVPQNVGEKLKLSALKRNRPGHKEGCLVQKLDRQNYSAKKTQ